MIRSTKPICIQANKYSQCDTKLFDRPLGLDRCQCALRHLTLAGMVNSVQGCDHPQMPSPVPCSQSERYFQLNINFREILLELCILLLNQSRLHKPIVPLSGRCTISIPMKLSWQGTCVSIKRFKISVLNQCSIFSLFLHRASRLSSKPPLATR